MNRIFAILAVSSCAVNALPAFPGAEGYGSETQGGRGGNVVFVTNLNASGPGSFKEAVLAAGSKFILFRVSGVVQGAGEIYVNNQCWHNVTLAGQTSPGGITITTNQGTPIWGQTGDNYHDIVIRFMRFRVWTSNNDGAFSGYWYSNSIFDHCDFSGGTDETLDCGRANNFTFQWCAIANAGPTGQNYGFLLGYNPLYNISFHHSLLANFGGRCGPEMHTQDQLPVNGGMTDYRNVICYNSGTIGTLTARYFGGGPFYFNVVGCTFKDGPNTDEYYLDPPAYTGRPIGFNSDVHYYHSDNRFLPYKNNDTITGDLADRRYGRNPTALASPVNMAPITTHPMKEGYNLVLDKAGAWPRDAMNIRTMNDVRTKTGQYLKLDDALITSGPAAPADTDNDGMPDFWETAMGLNPNSASDNILDKDGDGYTNIEEFLNDLALARLCENYHNAVYPIPASWPDYNPSCSKSLAVETAIRSGRNRSALSINPNPAIKGSVIRIAGAAGIRLFDIRGNRIRLADARETNSGTVLGTAGLPAGLYIVRAGSGKKVETGRLLIQN